LELLTDAAVALGEINVVPDEADMTRKGYDIVMYR
jgi:hypothetical protein